jgi:hypothetical protein
MAEKRDESSAPITPNTPIDASMLKTMHEDD